MTTYTVSLDVESVLADLTPIFLEKYNDKHGTSHTLHDVDTWDWVQTEVEFDEFMSLINELWRERTTDIPVGEPNLDESITALHSHPQYTIDIVTGRTGVEDEMQTWLHHNGITSYNEFISTNTTKATLGYDYYIDDNPHLADALDTGQLQYLITARNPYTREAVRHTQTIPVRTVDQATTHLLNIINR